MLKLKKKKSYELFSKKSQTTEKLKWHMRLVILSDPMVAPTESKVWHDCNSIKKKYK